MEPFYFTIHHPHIQDACENRIILSFYYPLLEPAILHPLHLVSDGMVISMTILLMINISL